MVAYTVFAIISVVMVSFSYNSGMSDILITMTILVGIMQLGTYLAVALRNPGVANSDTIYLEPSQRDEKRRRDSNWYL